MREAIEQNVERCGSASDGAVHISKKEAEMLLGKLSRELGIDGGSTKTLSSPGTSLGGATLRDVLYSTRKQERKTGSGQRPRSAIIAATASRASASDNLLHRETSTGGHDDRLSEQELCDLLHDASLDDSTIEEAMR